MSLADTDVFSLHRKYSGDLGQAALELGGAAEATLYLLEVAEDTARPETEREMARAALVSVRVSLRADLHAFRKAYHLFNPTDRALRDLAVTMVRDRAGSQS